jgi:hypothetical protein
VVGWQCVWSRQVQTFRTRNVLLTNWTNSMEKSCSWQASSHSASQEICCYYGTWMVITMFTRAPCSTLFWVTRIPACFLKIHFIIILPSVPRSSTWFHTSGFSTRILFPFLTFLFCAKFRDCLIVLKYLRKVQIVCSSYAVYSYIDT